MTTKRDSWTRAARRGGLVLAMSAATLLGAQTAWANAFQPDGGFEAPTHTKKCSITYSNGGYHVVPASPVMCIEDGPAPTTLVVWGNDDATIYGGSGRDTINLFNGHGAYTVYAGDGHDTIRGSLGNDFLHGGNGEDDIEGNDGNDSLYGHFDRDRLDGGAGDDYVHGGPGSDTCDGGTGSNHLVSC